MSTSSNGIKLDSSVTDKITRISFNSVAIFLSINMIIGGITVIINEQIISKNNPNESTYILGNCLVYTGVYLYFSTVVFYQNNSKLTLFSMISVLIAIIVSNIFSLLPRPKIEWRADPKNPDIYNEYTVHKTDPEIVTLILLLNMPIIFVVILILTNIFD